MRAKAADPPMTMSEKIIAHHHAEVGAASGNHADLIEVKVDQIALAREPSRILGLAIEEGLTKSAVDVSVAYPPRCVDVSASDGDLNAPHRVPREAIALGFLTAQPGAGFASAIHLERFAGPARLILSDEPRLANSGAVGALSLPASRGQLTEAARTGKTLIRTPRSVQVVLSGRLRPFVCVRDAALELLSGELATVVQEIDRRYRAPVVLEFGGPSIKLLSVAERSVLCAVAPKVGAAAALCPSDEKTETFLRDQRRSKAHRALHADFGAPWEEIFSLDLASVEPLLMEENGKVIPLRNREGEPISQALLGGDTGVTLRDFFAAAALLKSKRVSPGVDFLLCPPSRQTLEVLARTDALVDLIAAGARLIEPDRRVMSGELYPGPAGGHAIRTCDQDGQSGGVVVSPESLAYAVAHGRLGDPRNFKRPVRVSVPRQLPTDDVLISRGTEARGGAKGKGRVDKRASDSIAPSSDQFAAAHFRGKWQEGVVLKVDSERTLSSSDGRPVARSTQQGVALSGSTNAPMNAHENGEAASRSQASVFVAQSLDDVRWLLETAPNSPHLRAVIAAHIPASAVSILSGLGILALRADDKTLGRLVSAQLLSVPEDSSWLDGKLALSIGEESVYVEWLAVGEERLWAARGGRTS